MTQGIRPITTDMVLEVCLRLAKSGPPAPPRASPKDGARISISTCPDLIFLDDVDVNES